MENIIIDYKSMLKEYYRRYLLDVRGNSSKSVSNYLNALNTISRILVDQKLIQKDIFEIIDLEQLNKLKKIVFADKDFIALNTRGKGMYSAALNNYCRFADGNDFSCMKTDIKLLDMPIAVKQHVNIERKYWKRSSILRKQSLELSGYKCEINHTHETFISRNTNKPYMECHHTLPLALQDKFNVSLDVYSNIICLCPLCHRKIHYGLQEDRHLMFQKIYTDRVSRMNKAGISLDFYEFESLLYNI